MTPKCAICKRTFPDKYIGGIRDSTGWKGYIICGKCYNEGHDSLKNIEVE